MRFRNELKYQISPIDYHIVRQRLISVLRPDPNAGPDGMYKIRSLYFETPDDKVLQEKLTGVKEREKFRIRYYNDDYSFIRLEKKYKNNSFGNKRTAPLTREQCEMIIAGDIQWMRDSEYPLLVELYGKMKEQRLKPKVIVDYIREPFVFPAGNVRVTLDSNIRTSVHSLDMFDPDLPMINVLGSNPIIMEVKYDEYLPDVVKSVIGPVQSRANAFSKYGYSRMFG